MFKKLVFVALLFATSSAFAQIEIKSEDIAKYVGQKVAVTAKVAGIYKKNAKLKTLNMVNDFPNHVFQAIIFQDNLEKFPDLDKYEGKEVLLLGEVVLYPKTPQEGKKQQVQIILNTPEQIEVKL
jgi:hypothetical protein